MFRKCVVYAACLPVVVAVALAVLAMSYRNSFRARRVRKSGRMRPGDSRIGPASWRRRSFPVPVPRFIEAGLGARLSAQIAALIHLSFRPRDTRGSPRRFANRRRVSLSVATISR